MTLEQLQSFARLSGRNLVALLDELADEIREAASVALETAQDDGSEKASITLSHSIKIDLVKNTYEDSLAVSVRHKNAIAGHMPDPNQPELFEEEAE